MTIDVQAAIRSALGPHASMLNDGALRSAADGVLRALGSFPVGDPPAMRIAAARLREIALATRQEADRMGAAVEGCRSWVGHARDRLAARIREEVRQAHERATRLENSANALTAAAGRVENAQHAWQSRLNHLRDDAVSRLRTVALGTSR
jgi:hypothetical protein